MDSVAAPLSVLLAVTYLLLCFRWVPRSVTLVRRLAFFPAHLERPLGLAGPFPRALAFGFPLPVETLLPVEGACLRPLPAGVWVCDRPLAEWARPGRGARVVPWSDVGQLKVSGLELTGAGVRHRFGSRRAAEAARRQLEVLGRAAARSEARRAELIDESLAPFFALDVLAERVAPFRRSRPRLAATAALLLGSIIGVLWGLLQPDSAWWLLLPLLAVSWAACLAAVAVSARQVLPPALRPSRWHWLWLLVFPVALVRAGDLIESELLADFEPAAVAAGTFLPADAVRVVAGHLRALEHPLTFGEGPHLDDRALRKALIARLERLLPVPRGALPVPAGLHCPRCLTTYRPGTRSCGACPGVGLVG